MSTRHWEVVVEVTEEGVVEEEEVGMAVAVAEEAVEGGAGQETEVLSLF